MGVKERIRGKVNYSRMQLCVVSFWTMKKSGNEKRKKNFSFNKRYCRQETVLRIPVLCVPAWVSVNRSWMAMNSSKWKESTTLEGRQTDRQTDWLKQESRRRRERADWVGWQSCSFSTSERLDWRPTHLLLSMGGEGERGGGREICGGWDQISLHIYKMILIKWFLLTGTTAITTTTMTITVLIWLITDCHQYYLYVAGTEKQITAGRSRSFTPVFICDSSKCSNY